MYLIGVWWWKKKQLLENYTFSFSNIQLCSNVFEDDLWPFVKDHSGHLEYFSLKLGPVFWIFCFRKLIKGFEFLSESENLEASFKVEVKDKHGMHVIIDFFICSHIFVDLLALSPSFRHFAFRIVPLFILKLKGKFCMR